MIYKLMICAAIVGLNVATNSTDEIPKNITDNISFIYYFGNTFEENETYSYNDGVGILNHSSFDKTVVTIFFTHGYSEKPSEHNGNYSSDLIPEGFFKANFKRNLIVVNYENLVTHFYNVTPGIDPVNMGAGYAIAVKNSVLIGKALGRFLTLFITQCKCLDNIRCIGFSIGAQVMSYAAKEFGQGCLRLTGLDPAGPGYETPMLHLTKDDGKFVDVIHTDAGGLGFAGCIGTVDFWPNGGTRVQPSCPSDVNSTCSHYMAPKFYSVSIYDPSVFIAEKCCPLLPWSIVNNLFTCDNTMAYMGYHVNTSVSGNYYLRNNGTPPYSLGSAGLYNCTSIINCNLIP